MSLHWDDSSGRPPSVQVREPTAATTRRETRSFRSEAWQCARTALFTDIIIVMYVTPNEALAQ